MNTEMQARVFAAMAVCGAALGGVYDLLNLTVKIWHGGIRLQAAADLVFGAAAAAGIILTGLFLCTEPFRLFVFTAQMIGFALYMTTLGTIVRFLNRKLHRSVKKS